MKNLYTWLSTALLLVATQAGAAQLIMVRSTLDFPEAMSNLQAAISEEGYTVARVQRVDIGLTSSGYQTDKYRVVFFGKAEEVAKLTAKHPELIPYLPWKIVVFAEQAETLMVATDPEGLSQFLQDPELARVFERWHQDIVAIMERVRSAE